MTPELLDKIAEIKRLAKIIGADYRHTETIIDICEQIDCTLDQLTELNYDKLKDGDHHGWKEARESLTCYNCGESASKEDLEDCVPGMIICGHCCGENSI